MQKELYKEYVKLQQRIDELDAVKMALREKIQKELAKTPEKKEKTEWGTFTIVPLTKWEYTKAVKALEDKVKIAKDKEQKKGLAKPIISESLRFSPKHES